eukprot:1840010-Rhodomonas_salina.3
MRAICAWSCLLLAFICCRTALPSICDAAAALCSAAAASYGGSAAVYRGSAAIYSGAFVVVLPLMAAVLTFLAAHRLGLRPLHALAGRQRYRPLSPSGFATRCPVLSERMVLCVWYAVSGTERAYGAMAGIVSLPLLRRF